jgi:cytochrome c
MWFALMKSALPMAVAVLFGSTAMADETGDVLVQKCKICHSLDKGGPNRVGPNLFGVFGRKAGTVPGFAYSPTMKDSGIVWSDETLANFLRSPKELLPGNRMSFPGITDDAALQDLLGRLKQATQ